MRAGHIAAIASAAFVMLPGGSCCAEDMRTLANLSAITTMPTGLLCSKPLEYGTQYLACDAYKAYGEPISPVTELSSTKLAIRYVIIPSFHTWSVLRLEISTANYGKDDTTAYPEGTITVSTQTEDNSHAIRGTREADAKTPFVRSYKLSEDEISLILENIDLPDAFASVSTPNDTHQCVDGTEYVVELAENARYHWTVLSCFYDYDSRDKTLYQLESLLELIVRSYASQDLQRFPGD